MTLYKVPSEAKARTRFFVGESLVLALLLTAVCTVPAWLRNPALNWWEISSVFFSFACTWLCTRQVRFNYVLGVIATSLLVVTFYQAHLFGSMALNLYLIPTVVYGWFVWGKDESTKPVQHVTWRGGLQYLGVTALTWAGAYLLLTYFGGSLARLDGWLLVGSVLAQWMMDRKKLENWIIWAVVDVVSIWTYWHAGLHLLSLQFAFFLLNAVIAYWQWHKAMKAEAIQGPMLTSPATTASTTGPAVDASLAGAR